MAVCRLRAQNPARRDARLPSDGVTLAYSTPIRALLIRGDYPKVGATLRKDGHLPELPH